ncbi:MAG: hypothetical protein Q8L94_17285 [Parvibaculum sp.]|uniref:hypothetical protein n=1 Tax=Parvibaculum sp. TaxID=2024848 RepID=UPI0027302752|nr:hypothetical protein [Parvibaculum sp.]MDP1628873.1 hypothetical protein [Parvibaculum sp.]MDP2148268.1 hypothetical protein [Parvibaculum sp.]
MLDTLIPPQYRMMALVAVFAVATAAAFTAGWTANGWRIGKAAAEDQVSLYEKKLDEHGQKLDALTGVAKAAIGREDDVLKAMQEGSDAMRAYVEAGNTCLLSHDDIGILRAGAARRRAARDGG